jgi:hypothetical protein
MRQTFDRSATLGQVVVTLAVCATLGVAACGGNPAPTAAPALSGALSAAGPLLGSIGSAVPGLSQAQSILGVGSLLGLAKAKMPADQFSQIGAAIPGADALVGEAVKQGLPSTLGSLADVSGFLGKSGISASQLNEMIPVLGKALSGKVSPALATSFLSALK